jgi:hypothetical protein
MPMIAARLASTLPSLRFTQISKSLRQVFFVSPVVNSPTSPDLSISQSMGLFSQIRPLATYTNATTEVIDPPNGGKVR